MLITRGPGAPRRGVKRVGVRGRGKRRGGGGRLLPLGRERRGEFEGGARGDAGLRRRRGWPQFGWTLSEVAWFVHSLGTRTVVVSHAGVRVRSSERRKIAKAQGSAASIV